MLPRKHPDGIHVAFDDHRLVANSGLLLSATLALRLGLGELVDRNVGVGDAPGRANVGDKLLTLVVSALAGGDCIDDADALRSGGTGRVLALFPDETRLRQARRLLARYPGPVYMAQERDAARSVADDAVWRLPPVPDVLSLEEALANLRTGGGLPAEPPLARASLPESTDIGDLGENVPNHLLPVLLKPADKRMLDCLSDWPWATVEDLCRFLEISDSRVWRRVAALEAMGLVAGSALGG